MVNANYEFIYVDVGKQGRMSDSSVFEWTSLHKNLQEKKLNIPTNDETRHNLNFVLLGDAAFPLHEHILKPYPQNNLTHHKRIFNYRLFRARDVVENAFGLLAARFRVFHTSLAVHPEKINMIVLAACVLHNFLRRHSSTYITLETDAGEWRNCNDSGLHSLASQIQRNATT